MGDTHLHRFEHHSGTLSAWAVAGITGNNTSEIILRATGGDYNRIIQIALLLYVVALFICLALVKDKAAKNKF